uniref:pyridoxal 5'-phosphate synthase n=1 Tax=Ditylenchus dipsaci TaxID=166011 RepID=A0A915EAP2_9BILA
MAELIKDVSAEQDGTQVAVQIHDLRKKYFNSEEPIVLEQNMDQDPFIQFDKWFKNVAAQTEMSFEEVNAVNIATCVNNKPSSRMVLLKEYSSQGFTFYTNSVSKKGQDLNINPNAAMLFYWPKVDRQIRIEGVVSVQDDQIALNYWNKRPLASRISNMLSEQSSVVPSRQYLEDKKLELEKLAKEHGAAAITKPKHGLDTP